MNKLEKRVEALEGAAEARCKGFAIVAPDFTGQLPSGVFGICTGVPRHGDVQDRPRVIRASGGYQ